MKNLTKTLALFLAVALVVSTMLAVGVVSVAAEDKVLVWEGYIDEGVYFSSGERNTIYLSSISQAIHDDIAAYGPVTQYNLTSSGSYCYNGDYVEDLRWGLYQDDPYLECWADNGSTIDSAVWSDAYALANAGNGTYLCFTSDGDYAYIGYVRLFATHKISTDPDTPAYANGTTGDCTWSLEDKVLTISGFGAMADYGDVYTPWGTDIEKVFIDAGVTQIGYRAFFGCKSLAEITVAPNSNTYASVDGVVFDKEKTTLMYCPEGKEGLYIIPEGVESIDESAFLGCEKLASVSIPSSVTEIGDYAFYGTELYNNPNNYDITGMLIVDGWLLAVKPERVPVDCEIDNGIVGVAGGAFRECSKLLSVSIPSSVKYIGDYAFCYCSNLKRVDIPNGVERIGDYAFNNCSSLVSFFLSNSVKRVGYGILFGTPIYNDFTKWKNGVFYIDSWVVATSSRELPSACDLDDGTVGIADAAFNGCEDLESVTFPESVEYIGEAAFLACTKLGTAVVPQRVTRIEDRTFYNCPRLSNVTLPDGVTSIGDEAFSGCERLTGITLPAYLETIGKYAFRGCNIDILTIPNYVKTIGKAAFYSCSSLRDVSIADSVESIGEGAFSETAIFREAKNWDYGVLYIGSWLISTKAEELRGLYTIKEGTTKMANGAFANCPGLKIINISSGMKNISDRAFSNCVALEDVSVPLSVTNIGDCAFYGCNALETVKYEGTKEGWRDIVIQNGNDTLLQPRFSFEGKEKTDPEPTKPTQTDPRQTDPTQTNPSRTNPGTDVMIGDVNGDSVVNMKDVLNLRKSLAGIDVDVDEVAADVNSDGAVNMKDVLVLRKYLAGIIDTLSAA